ncbi:hypothetical protein TSUD_169980 [Trifolium subterraneum]|uniref:Uncharacterized protein n=1 Tax=Trifolium subterraneum TaxID=3900 RepID=A0A2Z6PDW2_TRISU|nr:hypothetical protein TSUD_169980 [Trifolium subterraneum]
MRILLCERFQRLFDLTVNKSSTVAECFSLEWGARGDAWIWRRQLWAWEEEMLGECQALFHNFALQDQSLDPWHWRPDPSRGVNTWPIISVSLLSQQVVSEHAARLCSLFGSYASGRSGMKEITGYPETLNSLYLSYWTRSNFTLTCG